MADTPTPMPLLVAIIREVADSGDHLELPNVDARQVADMLQAAEDPLGHAVDTIILAGASPALAQTLIRFAAWARQRQAKPKEAAHG